jgi:D-glycerate 3-kinase
MEHFISAERLPESYKTLAKTYYLPILATIVAKQKESKKQLVVGINGTQGSGKSTVSALFVAALKSIYGITAYSISIDDFYLTKAERIALAEKVHPLLRTRGVPGTHDIELANDTLDKLAAQKPTSIPRFNKATDDRHGPKNFSLADEPADIIILEGWCVGATPQSSIALEAPANPFEKEKDPDGTWRQYANQCLQELYTPLFNRIDCMVMLKAPSFDSVYRWRVQQEEKLAESLGPNDDRSGLMSAAQILDFIQGYQRLTDHILATLPSQSHFLIELDDNRKVKDSRRAKAL